MGRRCRSGHLFRNTSLCCRGATMCSVQSSCSAELVSSVFNFDIKSKAFIFQLLNRVLPRICTDLPWDPRQSCCSSIHHYPIAKITRKCYQSSTANVPPCHSQPAILVLQNFLFIYSPLSTFPELDDTVFVSNTSNKILLYSWHLWSWNTTQSNWHNW